MGFLLIAFLVSANIFVASSGFHLITKKKKLEYILIFEAFLVNIAIIFVSSINLFKEVLPDNFYFGIIILILVSLFFILSIILIPISISIALKGSSSNINLALEYKHLATINLFC